MEFYVVGWGFTRPQGTGMRLESFPCHVGWGEDETRQNHAGEDEEPILQPYPAPLPSHEY